MKVKPIQLLAVVLVTGFATAASAASITLAPTTPTTGLAISDTVSFDVIMDFTTDTNGLGSDITLGGGFDINYDPSRLSFASLSNACPGDVSFCRDPDDLPGLLESWGFADFNGLTGPALVGSVQFDVIGLGSSLVSTGATSGIAGGFVSGVDFVTLLNVDFNSVEVSTRAQVIPLPAAGLLLLAGLGALFGLRRAT